MTNNYKTWTGELSTEWYILEKTIYICQEVRHINADFTTKAAVCKSSAVQLYSIYNSSLNIVLVSVVRLENQYTKIVALFFQLQPKQSESK